MAKFPGLVGDSARSRSAIANCEETWNWYVEDVAGTPKATPVLYPTPGFTLFASLPKSPIRGLWAQDNRTFVVAGDALYELRNDGTNKPRVPTALVAPLAPTVTISKAIPPLNVMRAPAVLASGVAGTTTYGYKVIATTPQGTTEASAEGTTTNGAQVLNTVNSNLVSWTLVTGATGYKLYRTTGGPGIPPRLIATIVSPLQSEFADTGIMGTVETPPVTNTSGSAPANTLWGYRVVATNLSGTTEPSPEGTVLGYPVLGPLHFNTVTWIENPSCTGYQVYRTTSPEMVSTNPAEPTLPANTLVLVATIVGSGTVHFEDKGFRPAADALPPVLPVTNTTQMAGLAGGSTLVSISSSGDAGRELFICAGGTGYIFDLDTNAFQAVVADVSQGGFIDGYFVALDGGSSTLRVSAFLDGLAWNPTNIAQRTVASDKWLSMLVVNREIWLFGEQTSEVWVNLGSASFPFGPNPNAFIEAGSGAIFSPVRVGQELIFLGQDQRGQGLVFRPRGYSPERISTHAVEAELQQQANLSDAEAWGYQQDGHAFYVLSFPSANKTYVYDLVTGRWANRGTWNPLTMRFDCYRARCHCLAFGGYGTGKHLVGDRLSGQVFQMTLDVGQDISGGVIRRVRRAPHLHHERVGIAYHRLEIDLEVGLGLTAAALAVVAGTPFPTVQGEDPTVMLRWSDDGSKTWSNEHWTSAGRIGRYRTRARWSRLGSSRDRVFEFACTDPVPWRVIDATLGVDPGAF